jgi:hypothetical protein
LGFTQDAECGRFGTNLGAAKMNWDMVIASLEAQADCLTMDEDGRTARQLRFIATALKAGLGRPINISPEDAERLREAAMSSVLSDDVDD